MLITETKIIDFNIKNESQRGQSAAHYLIIYEETVGDDTKNTVSQIAERYDFYAPAGSILDIWGIQVSLGPALGHVPVILGVLGSITGPKWTPQGPGGDPNGGPGGALGGPVGAREPPGPPGGPRGGPRGGFRPSGNPKRVSGGAA